MDQKVMMIGIAGGSGSGKTTVAKEIAEAIHESIVMIQQDSYYKDLSHLTLEERKKINYDHPDALDIPLFKKQLNLLKNHQQVDKPVYDYHEHIRKKAPVKIQPHKIVIIEGILVLALKEIREHLDIKFYVDTDDDERIIRRINRDMKERGRTFDDIKNQYLETVKPMHLEFVEPSKRYADIIIPRGGGNQVAIAMIVAKIKYLLQSMK